MGGEPETQLFWPRAILQIYAAPGSLEQLLTCVGNKSFPCKSVASHFFASPSQVASHFFASPSQVTKIVTRVQVAWRVNTSAYCVCVLATQANVTVTSRCVSLCVTVSTQMCCHCVCDCVDSRCVVTVYVTVNSRPGARFTRLVNHSLTDQMSLAACCTYY